MELSLCRAAYQRKHSTAPPKPWHQPLSFAPQDSRLVLVLVLMLSNANSSNPLHFNHPLR